MENKISDLIKERIDAGDFPSAVCLVAQKGEIVFHEALGHAVVEPERIPAEKDTIFDLASLTKVLVTGMLAAQMVERGQISLADEVHQYVSHFDREDKRLITIQDLLAHTSGLPAWLPLYRLADRPAAIAGVIAEHDLAYVPRSKVLYSDPNFIVLQKVLENVSGKGIAELFAGEVTTRLHLERTLFTPRPGLKRDIAASENGNRFEEQTCADLGYADQLRTPHSALRTYPIWGEVHDGNAWFMGGVAGHAGLFSTAEEVFKIAQQFLPGYSKLLKPDTCQLFTTNFTHGMNEHRSFAFQLASTPDSTAGTKMPPESFGHNGFTGTSLWIDPVNERIFILLTNRTHDHDIPFVNINSVRRRFHDMAIELLNGKT